MFIRRGGRLPRLHHRGPSEDSPRALATKPRMGRYVGAWWRRPQARKEHSSPTPTLPSPGGRHQTFDDWRSDTFVRPDELDEEPEPRDAAIQAEPNLLNGGPAFKALDGAKT